VIFVMSWGVSGDWFERCSADVGFCAFAEGRVVPDNVSLSVASWSCGMSVFVGV